jgi:DNA polymerase-4
MAYFPSIEQLDFPELRGRPVAVTNGISAASSTIISSSYECRLKGISTGMRLREAQRLCPDIIARPSRPDRYTQLSTKIMSALHNVSPDIEIFSVDECFIDLVPVLSLYGSVKTVADLVRKTVYQASGGLRCSIGVSEGKLTAKYCAKSHKGGTTIIPPDKIKEYISHSPIGDICGIGENIEKYLQQRGVYKCGDIEKIPMTELSKHSGDIGRRLYLTCLGNDPFPVDTRLAEPKTMGHGKVLPPATKDKDFVLGIMRRLVERLSARLRRNEMMCSLFSIKYKTDLGWSKERYRTKATNQTSIIWQQVEKHFKPWIEDIEPLYQVQITAKNLESIHVKQLELFEEPSTENQASKHNNKIDELKDMINAKFGKHTLKSGTELFVNDNDVKPVIAFGCNAHL